jgi:hypothetical protein
MLRFLLLICCFLGLSCSPKNAFDPRTVETDAGAAVFRQLLADCPHNAPERPVCLTIGPGQTALSPAFKERFVDLKDRLLAHNQVAVTVLNGKARVQQKSTSTTAGPLVLLLQVSEMKSGGGGYEAIGAWAFKDEMVRRKYTVTQQADGSFKAAAGDIIEEKKAEKPAE